MSKPRKQVTAESKRPRRGFWRVCRIYFRRFRITLWFLILALLGALIYVNQIGLPPFIKKPLLEKLRARGIDLQFSRLRLRWYEGIVAENVQFGRTGQSFGPQLKLDEVQLELNRRALSKFQMQIDGLRLRRGRLTWPLLDTNQPIRQLSVENIQTELRFLPDDRWELDHFTAALAGVKIQLSGAVTNASAVRDWKFMKAKKPSPAGVWERRLRTLSDFFERTHFSVSPELTLDVRGDARELQSFHVRMGLNTPDAETPWGAVTLGRFTGRLFPATNGQTMRAEFHLHATDAQTPWAATTNFQMTLDLNTGQLENDVVNGKLSASSSFVETKWGNATNVQFESRWTHAFTNPIPLSGIGELVCDHAESPWGQIGKTQLKAQLRSAESARPPPIRTSTGQPSSIWNWWTNLQPYALDLQGKVADLASPKLIADSIDFVGQWRAPELAITNLQACLYNGHLNGNGSLDASTRKLRVKCDSDVDPNKVLHLLTPGGRKFLAQFSWPGPPDLKAEIGMVLPLWTNRVVNWRTEVQPTLAIKGQFKFDHGGAFRGVPVNTAQSHFSYSNMVWRLPDFLATRPEGKVEGFHQASDVTKNFYWKLNSTFDPKIIRPLLETNAQRGLDFFGFTQPPRVTAEIWGQWHHPELTGMRGEVALTNFSFRGQNASSLQTALSYTNKLLRFTNGHAQIGPQKMSAGSVTADFAKQKIFLTNGVGSADPQIVARAIGPKIARVMEPYHFLQAPRVRVHGVIPMRHEKDADLHFSVNGGAFNWWRFNADQISGDIHWVGEHLTLSDFHSEFYGGSAMGSAEFDFTSRKGADLEFTVVATNANLHRLVASLSEKTNNLEGLLSGTLVITNANSENKRKLDGYGELNLRDGLIWDIPVFGIFTPVLNGISPGLGNSRVSEATCSFIITNGIMHSDNLEMGSPALRLAYRGSVDLQRQVNARVDAELLRDLWGVGPVVSTVLSPFTKMFEYKITGSLESPKKEPVYFVPKLVQMPFHPFRSLRELLFEDTGLANTNSSPTPPQSVPGQ